MHSAKKFEKIKNDDLDLIYVYFSSIISYKYPFMEKNCPKLTKKIFLDIFVRSLDTVFWMGQVCLASQYFTKC